MGRRVALLLLGVAGCSSPAPASPDASARLPDAAPDGPADAARDAASDAGPYLVPLEGCLFEYTAAATVGGQPASLWLDTGSASLIVASSGCASCVEAGVPSLYTPGASARDLSRMISGAYNGGAWTFGGELYEDTVRLGAAPSVPVDFVAVQRESYVFESLACNATTSVEPSGILGLGPTVGAASGTTSFLDRLAAAGLPDVFAVELCDVGGRAWLGGFDPSFMTAPPKYTPILPATAAAPHYNVEVSGISVGNTALAVPASVYGEALVDTGGFLFFVPTAVFDAVTQAVAAVPAFQQLFGGASWFSSPNNCTLVTESETQLDASLPGVVLTLGTASPITLQLSATQSYLTRLDLPTGTAYCAGIKDYKTSSSWDIGSIVLRSNIVIFDRARQRMGFAPHGACP